MTPRRLLFVKASQSWPRSSGHDVHGYHMMTALAARGHAVSLATVTPPTPEALTGLPLEAVYPLEGGSAGVGWVESSRPTARVLPNPDDPKLALPSPQRGEGPGVRGGADGRTDAPGAGWGASPHPQPLSPAGRGEESASTRSGVRGGPRRLDPPYGQPPLTPWQRKFADYYGVKAEWGAALGDLLRRERFDAVVVVARHLLPLLAAVRGPVRVWYPADDPAWHHLSRVRPGDRRTWGELKPAAVNALYERAFRPCFDRVWVVSPADRTAARLVTGCRQVDLIPNGVDGDHYRPAGGPDLPTTCVFWGRLDFGPNVDALGWFLRDVWPGVRAAHPAARFAVFGFNPTPGVVRLAAAPGVELHPDLPDLRAEVARRQVVVLPFVTGGGIKNKLLEAAALGMPVVCTRRALSGAKGRPAVRVAGRPRDWATELGRLWADPAARRELGAAARRWVTTHHTWAAAAATAGDGIERSLGRAEE